MKKNHTCIPLRVLRRLTQEYPDAWEQMDFFHNLRNKKPDMVWPDWCWVPMAAAVTVVENGNGRSGRNINYQQETEDVQAVDALAPWRHSKQIYWIDPDLEKELTEDPSVSDTIPTEVLKRLPYHCVYIKTNAVMCYGERIDGFFAHLEYDVDTQDSELRFLPVTKRAEVLQGVSLHIDRPTIRDAFVRFREVAAMRAKELSGIDISSAVPEQSLQEFETICRRLLPLVVYLCADETDLLVAKPAENTEQKTEQKTDRPQTATTVRDRYAEIQTWHVGYRIGPAIRKYYEKQEEAAAFGEHTGSHTPKRPHIRRAHWHHFWAGSEGSRHLIVKWVSPIFVNVGRETDLPATIHPVR